MDKIEEYLRYAAECREMARTGSPGYRLQLEQMAASATWEQLANSRRQHLQKLKEAGVLDVADKETAPKPEPSGA